MVVIQDVLQRTYADDGAHAPLTRGGGYIRCCQRSWHGSSVPFWDGQCHGPTNTYGERERDEELDIMYFPMYV